MECLYCRGLLKPGKSRYTVNRNGYHLIFDDVPVFLCEQCGEPLFTEDAVRLVQEMIRTLDGRRQELDKIALAI